MAAEVRMSVLFYSEHSEKAGEIVVTANNGLP
jgi:hypothetical protein